MDLTMVASNPEVTALATSGAIAVGGAAWRWARGPLKRWWTRASRIDSALVELQAAHVERSRKLDLVASSVAEIRSQVFQNGGSSLRDVVDRLAASQISVKSYVTALCVTKNIGTFHTDADGRCTDANRVYLRLSGLTFDEVRGHGWRNALHPEDEHEVYARWTDAVLSSTEFRMRYRYRHSDGEEVLVDCNAFPEFDTKSGDVVGWLGTVVEAEHT